jgi:hypothetical protein
MSRRHHQTVRRFRRGLTTLRRIAARVNTALADTAGHWVTEGNLNQWR